MSNKVRVRFAPSPTGPLHIGGVRTALYNYLFAKQQGGTFLLRIEDTDQTRYVPGAEKYIMESLEWLGIAPTEGPGIGGDYGPYRQSERKEIYKQYVDQLIENGHAYYAFDSAEELDEARAKEGDSFKYGIESRGRLKNSISLSKEETKALLEKGENIAVRLKIPADKTITIQDNVRGEVSFASNELDDKVILKGDGMPTYHLANIVDDHLMQITHVIRGEEWLPSTAHHKLMYDFFGWDAPEFAHLPLILKPTGQGKLSKRDGAKFGFPVFPLDWDGSDGDGAFPGFREAGFMPEALINFISLLGWSPGNDEEIMSLDRLVELFSLDKIVKSGARFDYEKAKWYNQQYIMSTSDEVLAETLEPIALDNNITTSKEKLAQAAGMMKERVYFTQDIIKTGQYLFTKPDTEDKDTFTKKYKPELKADFEAIASIAAQIRNGDKIAFEVPIKQYIGDHSLKMGDILPVLRIALTGTMQGPDLFDTFSILGGEESSLRIRSIINQ
jgi:glutamyl-tRNA synthetase